MHLRVCKALHPHRKQNPDTPVSFLSFARYIRDGLSKYVLTPVGPVQRFARSTTRPTIRAYFAGLRFRSEAETWDLTQRQQWMLNRLRFTLRYAYQQTSFYRERFDDLGFDPFSDFTFDDFATLPVLSREDVHKRGKDLLASSVPVDQRLRDATGGSTGVPTEIWLGPNERGWQESGSVYFFQRLGVAQGARTGLLWGHHLDPKKPTSLRERVVAFVNNTYWFDCMRLSPEILESYHHEFQRWRPTCIIAYASALGQLAEHVSNRNEKPHYPTRCFVTGAEKLWSRHRELVSRVFGRPVHERYGARDTGFLAMQLEPNRNLHFTVDWPKSFIEPEHEGPESPVLITKLQADAMPMIRYRVGDLARFPSSSKPGHPAFTIEEVLGRSTDRLWLPDGRWISGIQIPHLLKDYAVREFLLYQRSDYSVELQIVPEARFDGGKQEEVLKLLGLNLPGLQISIKLTDVIPRSAANKWRPVISEIEQERQGKDVRI